VRLGVVGHLGGRLPKAGAGWAGSLGAGPFGVPCDARAWGASRNSRRFAAQSSVQTTAPSQITKHAVRATPSPVLLGCAQGAPNPPRTRLGQREAWLFSDIKMAFTAYLENIGSYRKCLVEIFMAAVCSRCGWCLAAVVKKSTSGPLPQEFRTDVQWRRVLYPIISHDAKYYL
jgi:hypothetical protein